MKKILITGGAGLIGSNLAKKLLNQYDIYIVDNLWRGKLENIKINNKLIVDPKKFSRLNLEHYNNCLKVTKNIDIIYHLADVVAGINYVFSNEFPVFQKNLKINTNMLSAAIENKVDKFYYVGTACSYPKEKQSKINTKPFVEEDAYPANPESSYGWSKLIGEYELELAIKNKFIDGQILRLHNVYGPPCELDEEKSQVIPALCKKIILNDEVEVWGSGNQKRAFVYVDDVINALTRCIKLKEFNGVMQIGPSESVSIKKIVEILVNISGTNKKIIFNKSKPEGDIDRFANYAKAKKYLDWEPNTSIEEGLIKTYNWIKKDLN